MPATQTFKLVLVGAYAGQDVILRGYKFKKGVLKLEGTLEAVQGLVRYMGKSYQAYLEGSNELLRAQEMVAFREEIAYGERDVHGDPETEGEQLDGEVQPDGEGPAEEAAAGGERHADPETGDAGSGPDGGGHEDPGVPETPEGRDQENPLSGPMMDLRAAVLALGPDVDENWTEAGLPAIAALEHLGGGVTRKMVDEAVSDWNRDKAIEAKALEDLS